MLAGGIRHFRRGAKGEKFYQEQQTDLAWLFSEQFEICSLLRQRVLCPEAFLVRLLLVSSPLLHRYMIKGLKYSLSPMVGISDPEICYYFLNLFIK